MNLLKRLENWKPNMINSDYRYTKYEKKNTDIFNEKSKFISKLESEHPRATNQHYLVSMNEGPYKKPFLEMYDNKCVYCGNSIKNIAINLFEIDHYINKASVKESEDDSINHINNLYPACKLCNSKKSGITFIDEYIDLFNPDNNIYNLFYRDEQFNIKIQDEYIGDDFIKKFYEKLKLNHNARRLDYLLLCMRGLAEKTNGSELSKELGLLIISLQEKRNGITLS